MEDIASQTTLVSGHPWPELREMIHEQVQRTRPSINAVQEVVPTPTPLIQMKMRRLVGDQEVPARQAQLPPSSASTAGATKAPMTTSANAASSSSTPDAGADP